MRAISSRRCSLVSGITEVVVLAPSTVSEIDFMTWKCLPPRAATSPAAHAVFDLLDTDRDGVVRRAEFFDAVGAVNQVVPPESQIDGDSVWGLLDCNGDGELERNELERGLRI